MIGESKSLVRVRSKDMDENFHQGKVSLFPFEKSVSVHHEKVGQSGEFSLSNQSNDSNQSFTNKIKKKLSFISKLVSVRIRENFSKPPSECGDSIGSNDQRDDFNHTSYWTATMTIENISGLKSEILSPIKRLDSIDSIGSNSSSSMSHCTVEEVCGNHLSPIKPSSQEQKNERISNLFSLERTAISSRSNSPQDSVIHNEPLDPQDSTLEVISTELVFKVDDCVSNIVESHCKENDAPNNVYDNKFDGAASTSVISSSHYESHSFESIEQSYPITLISPESCHEVDNHSSSVRSVASQIFPPVLSHSFFINIDHTYRSPPTESSTITTESNTNSLRYEQYLYQDTIQELNTHNFENKNSSSIETPSTNEAVIYSSDESDTPVASSELSTIEGSLPQQNDELLSNACTQETEDISAMGSSIFGVQVKLSNEHVHSVDESSLPFTTDNEVRNDVEYSKIDDKEQVDNFVNNVDTNIYPEDTILPQLRNPLQTMKMMKERLTRIPHLDSMTSIYAESTESSDTVEGKRGSKSSRFFMSMSPLSVPQFSKLFMGSKKNVVTESNAYEDNADSNFPLDSVKSNRGDAYVLHIASIYNKNKGNRTPDRLTPQSNPMSTKSNEKSAVNIIRGPRKSKGMLGDWSYRSIYKSITSSDYKGRLNDSNTITSPQPTKDSFRRPIPPLNAEALGSFDKFTVKKAQSRKLTLAARED